MPVSRRDSYLASIASEMSLRALDDQKDLANSLRQRSAGLLAAGSVFMGLLGKEALHASDLGSLAWLASGGFVVAVASALYVLAWGQSLAFALDGCEVYSRLWGIRHDESEIRLRLTYWLGTLLSKNDASLRHVSRVYGLGTFGVMLQAGLVASRLAW